MFSPGDAGREAIARMHGYAREAGRDPAAIGIEGRVAVSGKGPQEWITQVKEWEELGATHLSVGTGGGELRSPQEHIEALRRFNDVMDSSGSMQK